MRYAVISDIHGNLRALEAVLEDARQNGAERLLFLGDYIIDMPGSGGVADLLRTLSNAEVIAGNKEDYLLKLDRIDPSTWTYDQFAPVYWCYRSLSQENLAYLRSLPNELTIADEHGWELHLCHAQKQFMAVGKEMGSGNFSRRRAAEGLNRAAYAEQLQCAACSEDSFGEAVAALPDGAYLFGHNHLQWHARRESKLLLDAGSCGLPLDAEPGAAYTILTTSPGGIRVQERRVRYDVEGVIREIERSELYSVARNWSDIITMTLRTGLDHTVSFWPIVARHEDRPGRIELPVSNGPWRRAVAQWRAEMGLPELLS